MCPFPSWKWRKWSPSTTFPPANSLYVAFVDRINYSALYALEKMLECHTEPCLAVQSHLLQALKELRSRPRPVEILVDNISDPGEMASTILAQVVRLGATDVRVSGFDGFIWARLLSPPGYTDILFQAQRNQPELFVPAELQL